MLLLNKYKFINNSWYKFYQRNFITSNVLYGLIMPMGFHFIYFRIFVPKAYGSVMKLYFLAYSKCDSSFDIAYSKNQITVH